MLKTVNRNGQNYSEKVSSYIFRTKTKSDKNLSTRILIFLTRVKTPCKMCKWHVCNYLVIFHFSIVRSSHRRYSVKKGVLRNLAKFTGKPLWILRNFLEHLFYRTSLDDCFLFVEKQPTEMAKIIQKRFHLAFFVIRPNRWKIFYSSNFSSKYLWWNLFATIVNSFMTEAVIT